MKTFMSLVLNLLILVTSANAQNGISIQYSAKKIEVNEPLTIVYNVNNLDERGMIQSKLDPWILVGGPSISRSMNTSIINGHMTQSRTNSYTIQLICKKMGKFTVPKIGFQLADGSKVESQTFDVEVVKEGSIPRQQVRQPDPFDPFASFFDPFDPFSTGIPNMGQQQRSAIPQQSAPSQNNGVYSDASKIDLKKDIFARIHVNKSRVYVGEQIYASVKIYTAVNSKGFEAEKLPNFNGFWSQDIKLPEQLEMKRETINGREFVSVEIKKILLFPTKPGTLEITPLKMKTVALVPVSVKRQQSQRQPRDLFEAIQMMMQSDMGAFGGVEFKEIPYSFSSGTERVEVLPLPANAPKSFTGAVGKFSMNAFCDKKQLKTDDALNYSVEIQGNGNLPLIENPKIEWAEELEVFDPQLQENYNVTPQFSGTKAWKYTVIPHNPGDYSTPGMEFSYFDLAEKKYVTLTAPSTALKITGSPTARKKHGKSFGTFDYAKQKIKENQMYSAKNALSKPVFIGLTLMPLLLAFGLLLFPKSKESSEKFVSGKKVSELIKKQMKQAFIYLVKNDKQAFYNEVTRAYWAYLGNKLRIEPSLLSKENIEEKLKEKNVSEEIIQEVISLIESGEMGLYTSYGNQDMQTQYDRSLEVLSELDKQLV